MTPSALPLPAASPGAMPADYDALRRAGALLRIAGTSWFVVAVCGQLLLAAYVVVFYGGTALAGRFEDWNKVMPHGYVPGSTLLNVVLGLHLLFAAAIIVGGAVQLWPAVRRAAPAVHRWNGRAYLLSAAVLSLGGLLMVWTRDTAGDLSQHIAISGNALVILALSVAAWRAARARRIDAHRGWALRLFLAVSGVWFFRVTLMLWLVANGGPVGFDPKTFSGPVLTAIAFGQYLVPLAVFELHRRVQAGGSRTAKLALAAAYVPITLATAAGIAAASAILWLPRL